MSTSASHNGPPQLEPAAAEIATASEPRGAEGDHAGRREGVWGYPKQAIGVMVCAWLCGAACLLLTLQDGLLAARAVPLGALAFLGAALLAELLAVPLPRGGTVSLSAIMHVAGILLLPAPEVVLLATVASLTQQVVGRSAWYRVAFNVGSVAVTVSLTAAVAAALDAPLPADVPPYREVANLLVVTLVYYLSTSFVLQSLLAGLDGRSPLSFSRGYVDSAPLEVATGVVGGIVAYVWSHEPWWALVMVFPAGLTYVSLHYLYGVVTDQQQMQRKLQDSEARFRSLVQNASDSITILDAGWTILYQSPSSAQLLGYDPGELVGHSLMEFLAPDEVGQAQSGLAELGAAAGKTRQFDWRIRHRDGGWREIEAVATNLLHEPTVGGLVLNARDVSERKTAEAALSHQALHDSLTGLPNRALLRDRLAQGVNAAMLGHGPLALLVMDLDRFKEVNDTLGHLYGDELLQQVGQRLTTALRSMDTVARLGGDEFAIALPGTDETGAIVAAEKLLHVLQAPFELRGRQISIGASIGIAVAPLHGQDPEALLRHADMAMYVAKRAGGGSAVYDPAHDREATERFQLIGELRQAIERDELLLHFQPKLDLQHGRIGAVEALVRWHHPRRGIISPGVFIPLAEETGLIKPLTLWVLGAALRAAHRFEQAGHPLNVAVNISTRNLQDPELAHTVGQLLEAWQVPCGRLTVELTESAVMADPDQALAVLHALRRLGVRIAIDDYGTGYSSLAYLKRLGAHELKIDGSFVRDMARDENDFIIVRSTIDLGHNLGLAVIAEGAEDAETLELLVAAGCDAIQGFVVSRPLPMDALLDLLASFNPLLVPGAQPAAERPSPAPISATPDAATLPERATSRRSWRAARPDPHPRGRGRERAWQVPRPSPTYPRHDRPRA